jgi:hypothetical protein
MKMVYLISLDVASCKKEKEEAMESVLQLQMHLKLHVLWTPFLCWFNCSVAVLIFFLDHENCTFIGQCGWRLDWPMYTMAVEDGVVYMVLAYLFLLPASP